MSDGRTNPAIEQLRTNGPGGRPIRTPGVTPEHKDHQTAARIEAAAQAARLEANAEAANDAVEQTVNVTSGPEPVCLSCGRKKAAVREAIIGRDGAPGAELCGPDCYGWRLAPLPAAK